MMSKFPTALSNNKRFISCPGSETIPVYELCSDGQVKCVDRHNIYQDIQLLSKSCDSVERILALFTQSGDASVFPQSDAQYLDLTGVPDDPALVADWAADAIRASQEVVPAADTAAKEESEVESNDP